MAAAGESQQNLLKFVAFESMVDTGFWHRLSKAKLELYCLDERPVQLKAHFYNGDAVGLPTRCSIDYSSFDINQKTPHRCFPLVGSLLNTNTIEKFKEIDKQSFLNSEGLKMAQAMTSDRALEEPNFLNCFLLLSFADLKKYRFIHWFAFPALSLPYPLELQGPSVELDSLLSQDEMNQLLSSFDAFYKTTGQAFFAVRKSESIEVLPVSQFQPGETILGFCDPSTDNQHPGWPLRNLLALVAHRKIRESCAVRILCLRDRVKDGQRSCRHSLVLTTTLHPVADVSELKVVGWEKNQKGKLSPKMMNLSASMDPKRLADSSVNLNLQLMRWRLQPDLDLEAIAGTRCLLFGSGTLGCNVARMLMGWGVRHITMLDNGRVSFSNPVRQSLFTFEDSLDGGRDKAEAAVAAMRRIHPGLEATAVNMSVPMPGHPVAASEIDRVREDILRLEQLVEAHDVLFLLLDSREARWLPTLLGAAKHRLVVNAALGFESYLVMRHGFRPPPGQAVAAGVEGAEGGPKIKAIMRGTELGCYFCSDIVAPGNSTRDRALDQQCTVSRPGLSMIAAALAAELMVSVVQHPLRGAAPFSIDEELSDPELSSGLGIVPHQIRGFLSRFSQMLPGARAFDRCTACSDTIIDAYRRDGFQFLLRVFNDEFYLEEISGLKALQEMNVDDVLDFEDMDDMESLSSQ